MDRLKEIEERLRHGNQWEAYEWAKKNLYQSVAARYAHILAGLVDELYTENERLQAERDAAVEDIEGLLAQPGYLGVCWACAKYGAKPDCQKGDKCEPAWRGVKGV